MNAPTLRIWCLAVVAGALLLFGSGSGGAPPVVSTALARLARPSGPTDALELSIAVPSKAGERAVYANVPKRDFHVLVTNASDQPVNVWQEWCSWGYFALSFELTDEKGKTWTVRKQGQVWTVNFPDYWTLLPHENLVMDVEMADWQWKDLPHPAQWPRTFTMRAVFEVKPDGDSKKDSVWTGRIVSKAEKYVFYHPQ